MIVGAVKERYGDMGWPSYYEHITERLAEDITKACNEIDRASGGTIDHMKVRAIRSACDSVIRKMDKRISELWELETNPQMSAATRCLEFNKRIDEHQKLIRERDELVSKLKQDKKNFEEKLYAAKEEIKSLRKKLRDKEKDVALAEDFRKNPAGVYDRYPPAKSRKV